MLKRTPKVLTPEQMEEIRTKDFFDMRITPDDKMPSGKIVIFGHTPTEYYQEGIPLRIWYGGDKIGIDCGCGNEHPACRLACLRLDDMAEFYSE